MPNFCENHNIFGRDLLASGREEQQNEFRAWGHSEVIGLAKEGCTHCQGSGLRDGKQGQESPCNCVFRAIFKACYRKFRHLAQQEKHISRVRLEQVMNGKEHRQTWGMKDEEYMADFLLVTNRSLDEDEYRLFRFHYLLGADWKFCCRRLNMDRGDFFHEVYRIQRKLGRVYREFAALRPVPARRILRRFGPQGPARGEAERGRNAEPAPPPDAAR